MGRNLRRKKAIKEFMQFAFIPLLAFTCILLIPFLMGVFNTFTDWNGFSMTQFVGFENYKTAITDQLFIDSIGITLKYVLISVLAVNIFGFLLALLVSSNIKAKNFLRSVFFVPNLIGGVLLGLIWVFIFSRITVFVGNAVGLESLAVSWLVDPDRAFWATVIVTVWQQSGYMMLIYIAGLVSIDKSIIEASYLDGANALQQLRFIKIPTIASSFVISLFLTMKNAFMMFDVNLSLTGGGPFRSTEFISLHIYNEAYQYSNFATAQAKSIILFLILAVIAGIQFYATRKLDR